MISTEIDFPEKLEPLFNFIQETRYRYYILRGGRGGGKSTTACLALLLHGILFKHTILCTREYQISIKDSVHRLLSELIERYRLQSYYTVTNNEITGTNGTLFIFKGLHHNIGNVKSIEGVTICMVEEAQYVSEQSFKVLLPTIRKEGSEIWLLFNPVLETDDCYQRFVAHKPKNSIEIVINWYDNPFISQTLIDEKDDDYARNYMSARNIWGGECLPAVDGAIYQNEFADIERENRVCSIQHEPLLSVNTYWDLGKRDATAIWFIQHAQGEEHRVIDYYENRGKELRHYADVVLDKAREYGYSYFEHYLPHDVMVSELMSSMTRLQALEQYGLQNIIAVPRVKEINTGIEATRQILKHCWFDKDKCKLGLRALKSYRYEYDDELKCYKRDKPLHDHASNGSDAFRQFAQSWTPPIESIPLKDEAIPYWAQ